jgi:enamine deaminase RidA (YjgF/YER057c/UK114 family)
VSRPIERLGSGSAFEDTAGYCRAVRAHRRISVGGTVAPAAANERLADLDSYSQARRALEAALGYAERLGADGNSVIRTRMFLAPGAAWQDCARAHKELFGDRRPANTTLYVARLIPEGALVEVELDVYADGEEASAGHA